MLLQHPVLLQYTLLQHPLSSKDNASTSSAILAAASHAPAAAVLILGSTSTHVKVNVAATSGQKMSPVWAYFTKLRWRFRPRDEIGQEGHAACVADVYVFGKSPRVYNIQYDALCKCRIKALVPLRVYRRHSSPSLCSCFWRIATQAHPKKS